MDAHHSFPANQIRFIQNLEMIVDVLVEHAKTRPADVYVQEVITPCILPQLVQRLITYGDANWG
jgi:hypothetical protein